jgi:putative tricarboxylic transport membrane protein
MKFEELRHNRDFLGGLFYIVVGTVAIWIARDYPFGSALRMGPGYFPTVLSGIMILFGIAIMAMGIKTPEPLKGSNWSIRALIVLPLSTVAFGWLMEEAGFIPAMIALIPMSAASGREFEWKEVAMLTVGLTIVSLLIFIWGLGLPYPLIKGLWGY